MAKHIEQYDDLNVPDYPQSEIVQKITLDELAKKVLEMNYGLHRFLSALNRVVRDPENPRLVDQIGEVEAIVKAFEKLPPY